MKNPMLHHCPTVADCMWNRMYPCFVHNPSSASLIFSIIFYHSNTCLCSIWFASQFGYRDVSANLWHSFRLILSCQICWNYLNHSHSVLIRYLSPLQIRPICDIVCIFVTVEKEQANITGAFLDTSAAVTYMYIGVYHYLTDYDSLLRKTKE